MPSIPRLPPRPTVPRRPPDLQDAESDGTPQGDDRPRFGDARRPPSPGGVIAGLECDVDIITTTRDADVHLGRTRYREIKGECDESEEGDGVRRIFLMNSLLW